MIRMIILLLLIPSAIYSQQKHQERSVLVYNVGFGAITSGIGAVINKPPHTPWAKYFIKGCWQGAMGGVVNYSGKKILYQVNARENTIYALPATIVHAAGKSIIENAALNKPFLENWNIDYGPVRIDFSIKNKRNFKVRFLPETIYGVLMIAGKGKFDFSTTLLSGTIAFKTNKFFVQLNGKDYLGFCPGRAFIYVSHYTNDKYQTIAHELIHAYQYSEYQVFNTWLQPAARKIKSKFLTNVFSKYIYADLPYFAAFYELEGRHLFPYYYKNFFEFESQRFSTNNYVQLK